MTPASRGIPANNIRFQQAMKIISANDNPQTIALSQVIAQQRRLQTVSVQKPQQNVQQQQMTMDAGLSPGTNQQGQIQIQTSPNTSQQTVTQPQNSPQQVNL